MSRVFIIDSCKQEDVHLTHCSANYASHCETIRNAHHIVVLNVRTADERGRDE